MTIIARPEPSFASTLPGRYYYDPAIYAQEQEKIFSRLWVCVGRADALATSGAYQVVPLGGESVIVVKGKDNQLRAFLNVCRHRGSRLCTEALGQLKGSIQCKYHAWTYGLDGRLIGAPNVLHDERFDRDAYGLVSVALEVWEGLIWLNLADQPGSFKEQVQDILARRMGDYAVFERYGVGNLGVGETISYDVKANWKLIHENFMECYHCGPMHPELCDRLPGYRSGQVFDDGDAVTLADDVEAFTITGKTNRPPLPGLQSQDLRRYYGEVLAPNVLINLLHDHVVVHTLYPQGPDRTLVMCDWLFDASVMQRSDFDPMDAVELFDIVNRQDWEVCELAQQGVTSKAFRNGGIYVPAERHIREFCDFVLTALEK